MATQNDKKQPIKKIRAGSVVLTFWENTGKEKEKFLTCTVQRSYKADDGEWKITDSYNKTDLDNLSVAMTEAQRYTHIEYPLSRKQEE